MKLKTSATKILFAILTVLAATFLAACGGQTASTQLAPTLPTEVVAQSAATHAATGTAKPVSTDTLAPSPTDALAVATSSSVSFTKDVFSILESRCINCHGGEQIKEDLDMKTYDSLMKGSKNGAVIAPGDAANSLMAQQLLNGKMPKRGPKLTPAQVQIIVDWINAGAQNN